MQTARPSLLECGRAGLVALQTLLQMPGHEIVMSERRAQHTDAQLLCWQSGTSPHQRLWICHSCDPLKCVAKSRPDTGRVPHLGLPFINANAGMGPQFALHGPMQDLQSIRVWGHNVQIVVKRQQPFFIVQRTLDGGECSVLTNANNRGIIGSPCSPPSPCSMR